MGDVDDVLLALHAITVGGGGAAQGLRNQRSTERMVQTAREALSAMDMPEASVVSDLLNEDPRAANQHVLSRYGSWEKMYTHLHDEMEEKAAASAIRDAGGSADVPSYVRQRREFAAGMAEAGQTASAGQMSSLFPGPVSPQALGLDPGTWTGESMNQVLQSYMETGIPDFTPLEARPTPAGGVPDNVKLPTGWMWNPGQTPKATPIPGTNAEQDFMLNKILTKMLNEGLSFEHYFKKYPQEKAFFDASLRKIAKGNPLLGAILEMTSRGGGPSGGASPTGEFPAVPPSGRSNMAE